MDGIVMYQDRERREIVDRGASAARRVPSVRRLLLLPVRPVGFEELVEARWPEAPGLPPAAGPEGVAGGVAGPEGVAGAGGAAGGVAGPEGVAGSEGAAGAALAGLALAVEPADPVFAVGAAFAAGSAGRP